MADTIAVMNAGKIEQLGPPADLYERPRTAFVAGFLGVSNLLPGTVAGLRHDPPRGRDHRARDRERPRRRGRRRCAAGEDHDRRRRRRERARGNRRGDRVHRRRDAGGGAHVRGHRPGVRAEHGCRRAGSPARDQCRTELGPGVDLRRRSGCHCERGGGESYEPEADSKRAPAARRGRKRPAGIPVAARRLRRRRRRRRRQRGGQRRPQLLELAVLHRYAGVAQGCRRRRLRRRSSSSRRRPASRSTTTRTSTRTRSTSRPIQGRLRQGRRHRPRHHRLDRQRPPARRVHLARLGAEARQGPHPELREPHRRAGKPSLRPEPRVHAALVLGNGRDRVERGDHRADHDRHAAPHRSEAQGQGRRVELDGRHARAGHARERRRPGRRSPTRRSTARSP